MSFIFDPTSNYLVIYTYLGKFDDYHPDEFYELNLENHKINITANNYFGIRHGMETLSQLISYDEVTDSLQIHDFAHIQDSPKYSHRGIMIDSARNFIPLMVIKKIIGEFRAEKLQIRIIL